METWLLAAAGAVLVLLLALKLLGPRGGRDLTGPPRPKPFGPAEAARIGELVAEGQRSEALRLLRVGGLGEPEAERMVAMIERLAPGAEEDEG